MAYGKTREEQEIISRQSQLKFVLDWSMSCDKCLTLKEIVAITNVMSDYVMNGYSAEISTRLENIQSYLDKK
jgi:hypothetical protein